IDNKDSKKRYRADVLVEDHLVKIEEKIAKEVEKASKRFGDAFNEEQFLNTNPRVLEKRKEIEEIKRRLYSAMDNNNLDEIRGLIEDLGIVCPISGSRNWTDVRQFNLMFSTEMGSLSDGANKVYLRPETAQGIFVNYLNIQKTGRMKIPFGIAQMGKAFRNEIVARQFIFRMREFEQMEMQFFVRPGDEMKWFEYWKNERMNWHLNMGIPQTEYRFYEHEKLAHYANAAFDIEFNFPMGFKELEGIHSRTDFDLKAHQEYSGKKIQYFDPELNESYVPFVVETSIGLDRTFLAVLTYAYNEEKLEDGSERVVMKIPPFLAPIKAAVLPLVKKDGLPEKAMEIFDSLKDDYMCFYEEKDSIGKRYRRQDAIGTPYCITVDHQTLEDSTVTIRERDLMKQDRIDIYKISGIIAERLKSNR
ncbi:MAG: glycine--tRNA ligase, partial [Bacteroidales bacterium]|nr:glycine--tRNA ligase [Bacteroidales bacterium]